MKILMAILTYFLTFTFAMTASAVEVAVFHMTPTNISQFRIVDESGSPLAFAEILIGIAPGDPFSGNELSTDADGRIYLPAPWKSPEWLTIREGDHLTTSYANVVPATVTDLIVEEKPIPAAYSVKGETIDFPNLRKDGFVDFGMVIKGIDRSALIDFDLRSILSSQMDEVPIAGKVIEIPSNFTLPYQKESIPIPVTFNKPKYHLQVSKKGAEKFVAIHGRFPGKEVTRSLRNGEPVFNLLNHFQFLEGGVHVVDVDRSVNEQDLSVNQITFEQKLAVAAPILPANTKMLSISLMETQDILMPTDIKVLESEDTKTLNISNHRNQNYILSVLFPTPKPTSLKTAFSQPHIYGESFDRMSIHIEEAGQGNPEFLSLISPPLLNSRSLHVTPPQKPNSVEELGVIFQLSILDTISLGKYQTEFSQPVWKLFVPHWVDQIDLPQIPIQKDPAKKYRWEVIFLGSNKGIKSPFTGVIDIEKVTHISRSFLDL